MKLIAKIASEIKAEYETRTRTAAMQDLEDIISYIELNPNPDLGVISKRYSSLQKKNK